MHTALVINTQPIWGMRNGGKYVGKVGCVFEKYSTIYKYVQFGDGRQYFVSQKFLTPYIPQFKVGDKVRLVEHIFILGCRTVKWEEEEWEVKGDGFWTGPWDKFGDIEKRYAVTYEVLRKCKEEEKMLYVPEYALVLSSPPLFTYKGHSISQMLVEQEGFRIEGESFVRGTTILPFSLLEKHTPKSFWEKYLK